MRVAARQCQHGGRASWAGLAAWRRRAARVWTHTQRAHERVRTCVAAIAAGVASAGACTSGLPQGCHGMQTAVSQHRRCPAPVLAQAATRCSAVRAGGAHRSTRANSRCRRCRSCLGSLCPGNSHRHTCNHPAGGTGARPRRRRRPLSSVRSVGRGAMLGWPRRLLEPAATAALRPQKHMHANAACISPLGPLSRGTGGGRRQRASPPPPGVPVQGPAMHTATHVDHSSPSRRWQTSTCACPGSECRPRSSPRSGRRSHRHLPGRG